MSHELNDDFLLRTQNAVRLANLVMTPESQVASQRHYNLESMASFILPPEEVEEITKNFEPGGALAAATWQTAFEFFMSKTK